MSVPCSIDGCGKRVIARGWCSAHYSQWRKHGDPLHREIARRGEALAWLFAHVDHVGDACLLWPFKARTLNGYPNLWVDGRLRMAHRVICEWAHGAPPTPSHQTAHSCGNGRLGCVNPGHVRWATATENEGDKKLHGTAPVGERNPCAKLTQHRVRFLRLLHRRGENKMALGRRFGLTPGAIRFVVAGKTWAHIQ